MILLLYYYMKEKIKIIKDAKKSFSVWERGVQKIIES